MENYKRNGYIMVAIGGILWGSIGFFVNLLGNAGVASSSIAFCRLFFGFLLLIPLIFIQLGKKGFKMDLHGLIACLFLGLVSQALFNYFYVQTIQLVGVSTGVVLLYTAPVFVTIMARIFYKEVVTMEKVLSLSLCMSGCFLAVTGGNIASMGFNPVGVMFGFGAAFTYSVMTIVSKKLTKKYDSLTILFYSFMFGFIAMFPTVDTSNLATSLMSAKGFFSAVAIGLFPASGAYFFYMKGLERGLEASNVAIISSIEIVVSILFGVVVFNESLGLYNSIGILLLLLSLILLNSSAIIAKLKTIRV